MVYLVNDFTHMDDVYSSPSIRCDERKLSNHNAALWSTLALSPVQRMTYKGADGWPVDGFLVKPLNWQPGRTYPLVLSIHGGPAGQYGVDWFHEFQVYAAHGWAVFFTNPRGSTGYGRAFQRGIENEWGGKDYVDIMNGLDAAIAANPWIDTTKIGVTGGSYGGYMTNWIVGHTNRFKAAVTLRSISNFISDDGTRDGAYGHAGDFGGDIFQKYDLYWDRSPLKYVQNVTTPILDSALRQRLPRADRTGRTVVPRTQALRQDRRDRVLPAREPQPHAHRRASAPGRESRLAALLVRPISRRKDGSRRAGLALSLRGKEDCSTQRRRGRGDAEEQLCGLRLRPATSRDLC